MPAYGSSQYGGGARSLTTADFVSAGSDLGAVTMAGSASMTIADPVIIVFIFSGTLTMAGAAAMTAAATLGDTFAPSSAGFTLATSGQLSLDTPTESFPPGIEVRDMLHVAPTMREPVVLSGRPVHPLYVMGLTGTFASAGAAGVASVDTDTPEGPAPLYRWKASTLVGSMYTQISTWTDTTSSKSWASSNYYRPKIGAVSPPTMPSVSMRTLDFWWEYVQHMWIDLGTTYTVPYTWQFVGILHPVTQAQFQHIFDAGNPTPDFGVAKVRNQTVNDGTDHHLIRFFPDAMQMYNSNGGYIAASETMTSRACIITACYNGANSFLRVRAKNIRYMARGNAGSDSCRKLVLGRQAGLVDDSYASHMSLFEVRFWNQAVTEAQLEAGMEAQTISTYRLGGW